MDTETACDLSPKDSRLYLFRFLYKRYRDLGYRDFTFTIKKLGKKIGWNSWKISGNLIPLKENNILVIGTRRQVSDLWKTNFSGKDEGELENEVIRI